MARDLPAVLLGGEASALSVARSLGRAGIDVVAVGDAAWSPVRRSRFCTSFVHVPAGNGVQTRWLEWLHRGPRSGAVLPCTDAAVELLARNRRPLEELGYLLFEANDDIALAMLDKQRTYELARGVGVPTPRTVALSELDAAIGELGFPCALKPLHPINFRRHYGLRRKLLLAHDRTELDRAIGETRALGLEMLVTEIIPGGDDQVWMYAAYIDRSGEPLFHFTKRKLRQYPPDFGIGSYHVSEWSPGVAELGLAFFQGIGLRGLAAVEFKRDARDGRLVLIECNHRFPNATELMPAAGIDAALVSYNQLVGRSGPPTPTFREGVRLLHFVEDTSTFLIRRRRGDLSGPQWLRSLLHRQHFPVLRLDDPLPSLASTAQLLRRTGAKGLSRARRTRSRGDVAAN